MLTIPQAHERIADQMQDGINKYPTIGNLEDATNRIRTIYDKYILAQHDHTAKPLHPLVVRRLTQLAGLILRTLTDLELQPDPEIQPEPAHMQ